jgi:cytochrome b561
VSGSSSENWTAGQRRLHWSVALLVAAVFLLGVLMTALPLSALLAKLVTYQLHKSLGLLVVVLVLWRLGLRWRHGRPAETGPAWQRRVAAAGHAALYALLLVVPVMGYCVASVAPGQVPTAFFLLIPVPHLLPPDEPTYRALREVHETLAWALVLLAAGHAAMAVAHHRAGRETLRRMWRGRGA